jgi:hypothetical protein
VGPNGIWFSEKQANGNWSEAQPVRGGDINLSGLISHCFLPLELPGQPSVFTFVGIRPRSAGGSPSADIYTTRQVNGAWQPAERYPDRLLDSIANKCRFNVVTKNDFTLEHGCDAQGESTSLTACGVCHPGRGPRPSCPRA